MAECNGKQDSDKLEAPFNVLVGVHASVILPDVPDELPDVPSKPSQLTDDDTREPTKVSSERSDGAMSQHFPEPSTKAERPSSTKTERTPRPYRSTENFQRCEELIKCSKVTLQSCSRINQECIEDLRRCKEGSRSLIERIRVCSDDLQRFSDTIQRYKKTRRRYNYVTKESVSVQPTITNVQGIEGSDNSCYMDAALNSLFLFNDKFQSILPSSKSETFDENDVKNLWKVLEDEIVSPLCRDKILELKTGTMSKFRDILSEFNPSYLGSEMDPEEFLSSLFGIILKIPGFYWIDGDDEGSHVFQTYADMTKSTDYTEVQTLLEHSFSDSDILLADIPTPGFIVKMPVTDGRHMFDKIYPNPTINLRPFLKNDKDRIDDGALMQLSAVICLSNHHYTAYVREGVENDMSWWYLDSFAYSRGEQLTNMDKTLEDPKLFRQDLRMSFIMSNCYMCFYLPISPLTRP